ncbi:unnamed protein product [Phaeothamnion confervicola]
MRMALMEAEQAMREGEVPVGCVIVHAERDEVVGKGHNLTNFACDATRHAEFVAIDNVLENTDGGETALADCDLFVTCEPCIMCAAALALVRIRHVYFGCSNDHFGGCGSILSVHAGSGLAPPSHGYPVCPDVLKEDAVTLLRLFYNRENPNGASSSSLHVASHGLPC